MQIQFVTWAMRAAEATFFTAFVGCAFVVTLSWISIFKDGFSKEKEWSEKAKTLEKAKIYESRMGNGVVREPALSSPVESSVSSPEQTA